MMVLEQRRLASAASRMASCERRLVADPRIEASGVRRSCEIEVSRAERSRSVSTCKPSLMQVAGQVDPLDRQRGLVGERIQQALLVGRQQRARVRRG